MDAIILNSPVMDWITVTTWDKENAKTIAELIYGPEKIAGWTIGTGKRMQYDGERFESGYLGSYSSDDGRENTMMTITGSRADYATEALVKRQAAVKCTRMDAQITLPIPSDYRARELRDWLVANAQNGKSVRLIENTDGMDTVYYGSTASDRYTRIYVKSAAGGVFLRIETQLKGAYASDAYGAMLAGERKQDVAGAIIREQLSRLPKHKWIAPYLKVAGSYTLPRTIKGETDTEEWLRGTMLKSAVSFAARGDNERQFVFALANQLLERITI